jgi:hypothetical protein
MRIDDLSFNCYNCHHDSAFEITVKNRDEVERLTGDGRMCGEVSFICVHCGFANVIEITLETAATLLGRLSSADPEVQRAIERAKAGDYSSALDIAKDRLGFKF